MAWKDLCLPKVAGGWNVKDIELWNKAGVCKLLWDISFKKERSWSSLDGLIVINVLVQFHGS